MNQGFKVDPEILRNVATIPIVIELRRGPRFFNELVGRLDGLAAPQTIQDGISRLIIGGYVSHSVERTKGIRKRYELTDQGLVFAQMRVEDLVFDK
jgi:DNA-binding HxlR family transcriptional regulator